MIKDLNGIERYEEALKLFSEKKVEEARDRFLEILKDESISMPVRDRSRIYYLRCESLLNPVDYKPETFEDFIDFAVYYLNLDELDLSLKYIKEAEKIKSESDLIYYLYAILKAKEKDFKESVSFLERAISLNEKNKIFAKNDPDFEVMYEYKPFLDLVEDEEEEDKKE